MTNMTASTCRAAKQNESRCAQRPWGCPSRKSSSPLPRPLVHLEEADDAAHVSKSHVIETSSEEASNFGSSEALAYIHTYIHTTYLPTYIRSSETPAHLPTYLPTYLHTYIHACMHTYEVQKHQSKTSWWGT